MAALWHGQRWHVPLGEKVVSAQAHFSTSKLQMASPAHRSRKPTLPPIFQPSPCPSPSARISCNRKSAALRVCQEGSDFWALYWDRLAQLGVNSISLDGELTNVFLFARGWEVACEACSSFNFKKSLVKAFGRSFTVHIVRCGGNDLNDTRLNSSEIQEAKTTLTNTVHLTKRGRLSSRWKG